MDGGDSWGGRNEWVTQRSSLGQREDDKGQNPELALCDHWKEVIRIEKKRIIEGYGGDSKKLVNEANGEGSFTHCPWIWPLESQSVSENAASILGVERARDSESLKEKSKGKNIPRDHYLKRAAG